MKETYAIVVNQSARRGGSSKARVQKALRRHATNVLFEKYVKNGNELEAALKEAISIRPTTLIVGGGDGTIALAAGLLTAQKDIMLGVLPLGTANYFARNLGMPISIDKAIKVIAQNHSKVVSLGKVNDHYFTFMANIGVSVDVAQKTDYRTKRLLGPLAYIKGVVQQMIGHKSFECTLKYGDETHIFNTHELVIMNGNVNQHVTLAPHVKLDDETLVLFSYVKDDARITAHIKNLLLYILGRHRDDIEVREHVVQAAHIATNPKRSISVDGEVIGETPVEVAIVPKAIRVLHSGRD